MEAIVKQTAGHTALSWERPPEPQVVFKLPARTRENNNATFILPPNKISVFIEVTR
jgi:hypothetical protein